MLVRSERVSVETKGNADVLDITDVVAAVIEKHRLGDGQVLVFVVGSTAAVTTVEHEPGLVRDIPELFERIAPKGARYHHDDTWHDGNGHAHVRASLLGPSLTVPVLAGKMALGTWQQIVVVDFDTRPRQRELVIQVAGISA